MFCFVPLWLCIVEIQASNQSLKQQLWKTFKLGWITQFILTLIGFNWVAYTIHEFGGMNWALSIAGLILFCCVANLYVPISCMLWIYIKSKASLNLSKSLILLAILTALLKPIVWTLFPWDYAYTWYWVGWPIFQITDIIGFQGLSSLIILLNSGVMFFWLNRSENKGKTSLFITVFSFILLSLFGYIRQQNLTPETAEINVLQVQGNIGNQEKVYAETGSNYKYSIYNLSLIHI